MTNCRPTSGIVPVMVPLKGVPVVGACVSDAPTLYTHVPFRYARLMYQLLFRVPGRVARSSAPEVPLARGPLSGGWRSVSRTLISKANIRLAGRWMSCNDVLMFYVYNRVYKSVVFSGRSGSPCPAGLAAVVLDAWQPLSGHARTTLSSDLVRTLAVAPTAFSYDKDDGEGVGAGLFYVTASAVLRGEAHGVLPVGQRRHLHDHLRGRVGDHHGCLHRRGPFGGWG